MLAGAALFPPAAVQAAPPSPAHSYHLVFSDSFTHPDIGGKGSYTWYEGVWFHHRHAPLGNIVVANSHLFLNWTATQTSFDTSISTFSTQSTKSLTWRYGYFEARLKWDVVPGAWPAFWLLPMEGVKGAKETGEIDIFEGQGDHPHTYYGTAHDWVNGRSFSNRDNYFPLAASVDLSEFHVYGLLWTPGQVSWYLDGHLLHAAKTAAILDREHCFLVLGMQEGVNWKEGDREGVTQPKMTLTVDWVRVWQQ